MPGIFDSGIFDSGIFDEDSGTITRTAADSLSTLTESPTRTATYARTASASLATLTEAVTGATTLVRTVATSITSISEAVVASITGAFARTAADSLSTLTEAVTRTKTIHRTVADSISSISAVVTRIGAALRTLADLLAIVNQRVGIVVPYVPSGPFDPGGPSAFDLTIDAVSVLTGSVVIASMHFESQVNGVAGQCKFRVRDDTGTESYTVGQEIVLTINGRTEWRGFIATVNRIYVFPALNVDDFGPTRFFDIVGSDINILLARRYVFDQADGANVTAPLLPPHTADVTAIQELFADWLDLSGDGLDTTTYVENVADTTWTQEGRAWEGSDTWGQAMQSIARIPAAIYYIDPDKNFIYTDVDTPNAPFALSDQPNGVTSFGYREMEILMDGTNLANDVMCWGVGYGSQTPVFVRDTDATSQATHGLWQMGQTTFGVYLQATIDRIAASIIDGSPQSKRGAKNDRPAVMVTTYQQGLRVADKVDFTSNVFGYSDVIPIRKMEIDFETATSPKYSLTLSHEIDTPFSFFDPFMFDWRFPPFPGFNFTLPSLPGLGGCTPAICGITDTFARTVGSGWGTSDSGLVWAAVGTGQSVDGLAGIFTWVSGSLSESILFESSPLQVSARFQFMSSGWTHGGTDGYADFRIRITGANRDLHLGVGSNTGFPLPNGYLNLDNQPEIDFDWLPSFVYNVHIEVDNPTGTLQANVWLATDPEPAGWMLEYIGGPGYDPVTGFQAMGFIKTISGTVIGVFDNLDITGIDRCTAVQFDNFQRTVSGGWGTATPGGEVWTATANASAFSVDGTKGLLTYATGTIPNIEVLGGPWGEDAWTMTYAFTVGSIGSVLHSVRHRFIGTGINRSVWLHLATAANGGGIEMEGGSGDFESIDFVSGFNYFLKMEWDRTSGVASAKVWDTGSAEPAMQVTRTWGPGTDPFTTIHMEAQFWNSASYTHSIDYIDFDYAGRPCYPGGPVPGSGIPANTKVCEDFNPATTSLQMSGSFLQNSAEVFLNGLLQPASAYTEDGGLGTIVFDTPPTGTARVCYWALYLAVG